MDFETLKGKPERDLVARLNELVQENFKARFTSESTNPATGGKTTAKSAQIRSRRREIARIKTLLEGRLRLGKAKQQQTELEGAIKLLGKPHEGDAPQKNARRKLASRLEQVRRTIRELGAISG